MPYVFYDTETTGVATAFSQILQFAAIKTDDELNEIERFEVRCRLLPHIIPSPEALLVTRISPETLTDPGLPTHYEGDTEKVGGVEPFRLYRLQLHRIRRGVVAAGIFSNLASHLSDQYEWKSTFGRDAHCAFH